MFQVFFVSGLKLLLDRIFFLTQSTLSFLLKFVPQYAKFAKLNLQYFANFAFILSLLKKNLACFALKLNVKQNKMKHETKKLFQNLRCVFFCFYFFDYFFDDSFFVDYESSSVNSVVFFTHEFLWPPNSKCVDNRFIFISQ